jgi:hypothetical protein
MRAKSTSRGEVQQGRPPSITITQGSPNGEVLLMKASERADGQRRHADEARESDQRTYQILKPPEAAAGRTQMRTARRAIAPVLLLPG